MADDAYEDFEHEMLDEGPSAEDIERLSGDTEVCPECGAEVYADSPLCQECGHTMFDDPEQGLPLWVIIAAVVALGAFVLVYAL